MRTRQGIAAELADASGGIDPGLALFAEPEVELALRGR
jgi:hypothetical protein